jgi:hypothetical protein
VRDVQRRHDGDALDADDLAGVTNLAHLPVQVLDCLQEVCLLLLAAGDPEAAVQDADLDTLRLLLQSASSGIRLSRLSRRWRADSILSVSCLF